MPKPEQEREAELAGSGAAPGLAHVIGAFRVLAGDGQDITPRGHVRKALLAVYGCPEPTSDTAEPFNQ